MPAAKSKPAPTSNGSAKTNAASNDATVADKKDTSEASTPIGRPDKKVYDEEQERIKGEIEALQVKLSSVRDKIALATKSGPAKDRRAQLRTELDGLRSTQSTFKQSRGEILAKIKNYQDIIQRKIKDLQAAKAKMPYKNVADVDAHIKNLEKQVESGSMKLADEKRALQEISMCKRNRRTVESFQADQDSIEADRQAVDELKKQLDDPESKAVQDRYDAIKSELDELKKDEDEAYAGRSELFKQRDDLQQQLNDLYNQKRESAQKYKEGNDRYWAKVSEDRARRVERQAAQRAAFEAQKKQERAEQLLEQAKIPAFQGDIEDCQTLIDYFTGKTIGAISLKSAPEAGAKEDLAGVPKLDIRKVEAGAQEGLVARKKKGEDDDSYFVGGKGKSKGKKNAAKSNGPTESSSGQLNVPFSTLSALLALSIPPPTSTTDISRVVKDLETKRDWFMANQAKVTAENIAKAEAEIKKLGGEDPETPAAAVSNGESAAEKPAES